MVFAEMQRPDRHRVNAAKSVDTASSFALKAKYSAGRYCAALVSNSAFATHERQLRDARVCTLAGTQHFGTAQAGGQSRYRFAHTRGACQPRVRREPITALSLRGGCECGVQFRRAGRVAGESRKH